jgi:alkylation response protein AidB-like acyl-CoA dehydrogenase
MYTKKIAKLRDKAKKAADELRAHAGKVDEERAFPASHLELLWESGFMTLRVPRDHGGEGVTLPETAVVVEELARGSGAASLMVVLQSLSVTAIREFANQRQSGQWFDKIVNRRYVLSFALSEPEPEPDEKPVVTRARKQKSEYIIRGKKTLVSGAREADLVVVFAVTSPKARLKKALSAFVVEAGTTGMLPGRELDKAGLRGVPAVELLFEGCKAPAGSRLGRAGQGYAVAQKAIITAAPLCAALCCGLLAEALDHTLSLVRSRDPASGPLSEIQPIELALAEMAAGLDTSQAMTWAAAGAVEEGAPSAERLSRESKWVAAEAAVKGIDLAASMSGTQASLQGSRLERLSRDARAAQLMLGPNHIHRIEVARKLISGKLT